MTTPPSSASAVSATELADQLRIAIMRSARRLRQASGGGLSPTLSAALATIDRHGPLTPSELADREGVRRPTATRIVSRLEELEYLTRTRDPDDGRSFLVATTPAGAALLKASRRLKTELLARAVATLGPEDQATLARASELLEALLEPAPHQAARSPR